MILKICRYLCSLLFDLNQLSISIFYCPVCPIVHTVRCAVFAVGAKAVSRRYCFVSSSLFIFVVTGPISVSFPCRGLSTGGGPSAASSCASPLSSDCRRPLEDVRRGSPAIG